MIRNLRFFPTDGTLIGKSQNIVAEEYKKEGFEFSMKVVEAYFNEQNGNRC